jgi:hypothetical protein
METARYITVLDTNQASDAEVAARVFCGEKERYALLMRCHNQALYQTGRSFLKEKQDAPDT